MPITHELVDVVDVVDVGSGMGGVAFSYQLPARARPICASSALIIADGNLLPTVGAVSPGSTIGALGLKIADHLAKEVAA